MYAKGNGVPQNYTEAAKWYRKAAELGDVEAQLYVGRMYANGQGVPQDYALAHMWFNLAASRGEPGASEARDTLAKHMTPDQVAEAQRFAREWKPK